MKSLGADVLRLWVAATDYRGEMNVSDEILKRTSDGYRRLRNTARYLLSSLEDFDPAKDKVDSKDMLALDRWIVDRAYQLQEEVIASYEAYHFQQIFQKVHHFCAMDLGSFYVDIVKDRQYTAKADGLARRSTQTAMYHVVEALSRWLAPIISYTADEIWQYIPGDRKESIFLETWYTQLFELDAESTMDRAYWEKIMRVRTAVSKEVEQLRAKGDIGSSLNAEVELYCNEEYFSLLNQLSSELHFIFITSAASIAEAQFCPDDAIQTEIDGIKLKVTVSEHEKCVRCWHQRYDVGENKEHPELCGRCVENIEGDGETRLFA
jgi:isoleucyl-tRNA synthetase